MQRADARPFLPSPFERPHGLVGRMAGRILAVENRRHNELAVARLRLRPGERVLDLGCGPGVGLHAAEQLPGVFAAGVDVSHEMAVMARHHTSRAQPIQADVAHLPFPDGTFDAAYAVRSVMAWDEPGAGLREAHRVLRRGGRILVAQGSRREVEGWEAAADRLETLLERAGFEAVAAEYGPGRRPLLLATGWKA